MKIIIITVIVAFLLAFILGLLLGVFKKLFAVPVDEKVSAVRECLPGANCGACGYPGCDGFAAAAAAGEAPANGCKAGGPSVAEKVGAVLGVAVSAEKVVTVLACQGSKDHAKPKAFYNGLHNCRSAVLAVNGTKMCMYGCIGFGDCVEVCQFGALTMGNDGLPHVDYAKCTGCGICATTCPRKLFALVPAARKGAVALCSNRTTNKPSVLKGCSIGCIKCGKCEKNCPTGAIVVTNGIPLVDYTKCDSCGTCVTGCPTHVLKLIENIVTVQ